MYGIPIYPADCSDVSNNGLGFLLPTECTVEEIANGMYEATLTQPITSDLRWQKAVIGRMIKCVCPVADAPIDAIDVVPGSETITLHVYKVTVSSGNLRLRQKPTESSTALSLWPNGTEVIYLDQPNANWMHVSIRKGGQRGYMHTAYLTFYKDITQTIDTDPEPDEVVQRTVSREQLFRIYSIENDTNTGLQTIRAMHSFYDLRRNILNGTYEVTNKASATAADYIMNHLDDDTDFELYCGGLTGTVTGKWSYCNPVEAWLSEDKGILTQCKGMLIRDNFNIYMLPSSTRDMGVTIRRGKNLIGVNVVTDDTEVITRIIPCGKNSSGNPLYLNYAKDKNGNNVAGATVYYIESPNAGNYFKPRTVKVDYNVKVASGTDIASDSAARAELERLAYADFEQGCDMPSYIMDVDFILLGQNAGSDLQDWARLQSVHMFDTVTVIDEIIGLKSKARVIGYEWDVLKEQYNRVTLGVI